MLEGLILPYAATFTLAAARVGGFVAVSPFPGAEAPAMARLGLVLVLAVVVTPLASLSGGVARLGLGLELVVPATYELGLGLVIGAAFRFVLAAADVLGGAVSQAVGLGMPSLFNPAIGAQDTPLGHVMTFFAVALALALGVHRVVLAYLLESFRALPVGAPQRLTESAPVFVELAGTAIAVGTRLAMPVIATALAIQLVLALLARAAPSMQLFAIGFSVMVLVGLTTLVAALPAMVTGLGEHLAMTGSALDRLLARVSSQR